MSVSDDLSSNPAEFWRGVKIGIPILLASAPFAALFGAVAVENGMTVFEAALTSAVIFAGASQMVGIELFGQHIAPWLIVFSIFAVNFRHVLYSAAIGRHVPHWSPLTKTFAFFFLVDPLFAVSERRIEQRKQITLAWYMGVGLSTYVSWVLMSYLGAEFGSRIIPDSHAIGLDFLLPIYFLGLVMGFRGRPRWLPIVTVSAIASVIAFKVVGSPWHVTIGAMGGILLAAALPPKVKPLTEEVQP